VSSQVQARRRIADSEARFRQPAEDLQEANRLQDEFLATLLHELRTPLNAVLGWSHTPRAGAMSPEIQARALDALERNARAEASSSRSSSMCRVSSRP
jgi:signal transduction histidine kinase